MKSSREWLDRIQEWNLVSTFHVAALIWALMAPISGGTLASKAYQCDILNEPFLTCGYTVSTMCILRWLTIECHIIEDISLEKNHGLSDTTCPFMRIDFKYPITPAIFNRPGFLIQEVRQTTGIRERHGVVGLWVVNVSQYHVVHSLLYLRPLRHWRERLSFKLSSQMKRLYISVSTYQRSGCRNATHQQWHCNRSGRVLPQQA